MAGKIETLLADKKIELPKAAIPVANYVPVVITGNLAFVAGQVTIWNGEVKFIGKLGKEYNVEQGQQAARLCGLNILAQVKAALGGDLDRVKRCVKLNVFVNSQPDFTDQPKVANGVSDLMQLRSSAMPANMPAPPWASMCSRSMWRWRPTRSSRWPERLGGQEVGRSWPPCRPPSRPPRCPGWRAPASRASRSPCAPASWT